MRRIGFLTMALAAFAAIPNPATAAMPGYFTESGNAALLDMPNRVTPVPTDLNYPLLCIDSNGNGRDEIVSGAMLDGIWRVMEQREDGQSFNVTTAAHRPFPSTAQDGNQGHALFFDTSSPTQPKLYAQIFDGPGFVARYDVKTRALEAVAYLMGAPVGIRDLNGDGVGELITFWSQSGSSLVNVYDLQMSRLLASYRVQAGIDPAIVLGNFDDDPQWEIATTAGMVYEITLDSLREDGSFAERTDGQYILFMAAADVDADGKDEIVAAYWNRVTVIDHDQRAVKWSVFPSVNTDATLNVMRTIDVLGNATPEVVIGQVGHPAAAGNFVIFDGASGVELRTIEHPDTGVFGLNACDVDGDGNRDMIVGLNRPVTGPDRLYIFDPATGQLKWRSVGELGLVRAATMTDADGDGHQEVVFAPYEVFGVGDLRLHSYDANTLAHRWTTSFPMLPQPRAGVLNALTAGDADGDGDMDLVAGSSQNGSGRLWIVDGRTRALVRDIPVGGSLTQVRAVGVANVAGDSAPEVLAATSDGVLEVFSGASGTSVWQASWGVTEAKELKTADFNRDGATDVLLRVAPYIPGQQNEVFVVDGASHAVRSLNVACAASVLPLDVAGTPDPEVIIGGCDGTLRVVDAVSGSVLQSQNICPTTINALAPNNLSTAGAREVLFTCAERVGWLSLASGQSDLITATVGDQIGLGDNLFSGRTETNSDFIIVSTSNGIAQLRPAAALAPYVWPFNPTTTNVYSVDSGRKLTESITFGAYDSQAVTLEVVQQPRHGRLTITNSRSGEFQYESTDSYVGIDLMVVRARTAQSVSAPTAIPVAIREGDPNSPPPPNDPPTSSGGGGGGGGGAMDISAIALLGLLLMLRSSRRKPSRNL